MHAAQRWDLYDRRATAGTRHLPCGPTSNGSSRTLLRVLAVMPSAL